MIVALDMIRKQVKGRHQIYDAESSYNTYQCYNYIYFFTLT